MNSPRGVRRLNRGTQGAKAQAQARTQAQYSSSDWQAGRNVLLDRALNRDKYSQTSRAINSRITAALTFGNSSKLGGGIKSDSSARRLASDRRPNITKNVRQLMRFDSASHFSSKQTATNREKEANVSGNLLSLHVSRGGRRRSKPMKVSNSASFKLRRATNVARTHAGQWALERGGQEFSDNMVTGLARLASVCGEELSQVSSGRRENSASPWELAGRLSQDQQRALAGLVADVLMQGMTGCSNSEHGEQEQLDALVRKRAISPRRPHVEKQIGRSPRAPAVFCKASTSAVEEPKAIFSPFSEDFVRSLVSTTMPKTAAFDNNTWLAPESSPNTPTTA